MQTGRTPVLTPDLLQALRSPEGAALLERAAALAEEPFAAQMLRREGAAPELAAAAVETARLRLRARAKFAHADRMWFSGPLLEQSSGELIARHRARRYASWERVGDLCCGLGSDALALTEHAEVVAVDRDPLALALTRANAAAVGTRHPLRLLQAELPAGAPDVPAAWIDPGRREGGTRTRRLEQMSPPFAEVLPLRQRIPHLGIKLSPAADHAELDAHLAGLPHEREFLSVRGECRELALWTGDLAAARGTFPRRATLLPAGAELAGEPHPYTEVRPPRGWLLEPDAAVIRAGLVGSLADRLGGWGIDPSLAYIGLPAPADTPFGTLYRVGEPEPFSGKALSARLRVLRAGDVVFKTRGAAATPELLRQQLRGVLKQGGPDIRPVVFVTRLGDRTVMMLGERFGPGTE
ncbi:MAG TPA: SAM-dependent methyltransferase [Armatimonadota bacterium]|nr:SAM-dependent methyltransferase [Armatimonadota bacterium]